WRHRSGIDHRQGQVERADSMLQTYLDLAQSASPTRPKLLYYNRLCESLINLGRLEEAYQHNVVILEEASEEEHPKEVGKLQQNLAKTYLLWGRYDLGDSLYIHLISSQQARDDKRAMVVSLTNRARLLERRGDLQKAGDMYQSALEINREMNRPRGVVINGNNLGVLLRKQGQNTAALKLHRELLSQAEQINFPLAVGYQHLNIGINSAYLGQKEQALKAYQTAVKQFESVNASYEVGDTYLYLGDMYWRAQEYSTAKRYYQDALAALPKGKGGEYHCSAWLKLARLLISTGESEAALEACQQSLFYAAPGFAERDPLVHPTLEQIQMELDGIDALMRKGQLLWQKTDSVSRQSAYHSYQLAHDLILDLLAEYQTSTSQSELLEDYQAVLAGLIGCQHHYFAQSGEAKWLNLIWETMESNKATRLRALLRQAQHPIRGQLPDDLYDLQQEIYQKTHYQTQRLEVPDQAVAARQKLVFLRNQQD
ncbi:MAG: tetratricopeptide repeat protein, partial [Bacteroidota bacterium]